MKTCKKFTPEEVETIKKLYKTHLVSEIADILHRSPRVIVHKMQFIGLNDRPHEKTIIRSRIWKEYEDKYSMPITEILNSLYWKENKSLLEIAEQLNVCSRTVDEWMIVLNVPRRSNSDGTKCRYDKMTAEQLKHHMKGARDGHKRCCELVNTDDRRYERDNKWLKISALVKERDGYKCAECGITEEDSYAKYGNGLCVHHIVHYHICKSHDIDNLLSLCTGCHLKLHRRSWWDEVRKQKKLSKSEDANQNQSSISQF